MSPAAFDCPYTPNGANASVCSQCYRGTTKLGIYATSNALKESGAVGCNDMTTEAAVTKLYYLFSCGYPKETIKKLMTTNLRGEISKHTDVKAFYE